MKLLVSAAVVAALAWVAAPWVSMRRRGTVDRCTLEAMRCEVRIPGPRRASEDEDRGEELHLRLESRDLPSAN